MLVFIKVKVFEVKESMKHSLNKKTELIDNEKEKESEFFHIHD